MRVVAGLLIMSFFSSSAFGQELTNEQALKKTAEEETQEYIALRRGEFGQCLVGMQAKAREVGIPEALISEIIPNLEFLPRVLELDRAQPEFRKTFAQYISARVTERRVATGRQMLAKHADLLAELTKEYGVPGQYLVAFWGLETNYGGYLGKTSTLNALSTLACDPRRSKFFTDELFNALRLIDEEGIDPATMSGSWAGAVGHTQFMPSNYRRYAKDGDGDGRADLWKSEPDALTSAAHFLMSLGWRPEERWGREVLLPEKFDFLSAGLGNKRPLNQWRGAGVLRADGSQLPAADMSASILIPAGHRGPTFLAYPNFKVIMRWNRSESYAISVGHLADRIAGGGSLVVQPPKSVPALSRTQMMNVQSRLKELGFDPNGVDGVFGSGTRAAVREFQQANELVPDGFIDAKTLRALGIDIP